MAFSTTFKQDQREDFAHMATAQEHDQLIVYYPKKGGPPKNIRAFVEPDANFMEVDDNLSRQIRLEVTLSKDEAGTVQLNDEAAGHGGIKLPERGDQIWLSENGDPKTRRYVFTGFVIEEKIHSWTLEFKSFKTVRTGNANVKTQL